VRKGNPETSSKTRARIGSTSRSALSRSTYEYTLWGIVKEVAGEDGECFLSTQDLAALSMMSTGQVSKARKRLIAEGLLEGELRRDPGYPQPVWHLNVPDLWAANLEWVKAHPGIKNRVAYKKAQKAQKKSLHEVRASSGERGISPGEGGVSSGETKKNSKNKNEEENRGSSSPLLRELRTVAPSGRITKAMEKKLTEAGITPERVALFREDSDGLKKFKKTHPGDHPYLWPKQLEDVLAAFESYEEKSERQRREHMAKFVHYC